MGEVGEHLRRRGASWATASSMSAEGRAGKAGRMAGSAHTWWVYHGPWHGKDGRQRLEESGSNPPSELFSEPFSGPFS